jgi:hypothetical protein
MNLMAEMCRSASPVVPSFHDPVNGLRLEYTGRLAAPTESDRDPERRQFPVTLALFRDAAPPAEPDHRPSGEGDACGLLRRT